MILWYFSSVDSGDARIDEPKGTNEPIEDIGTSTEPLIHTYENEHFDNHLGLLKFSGRLVRDVMLQPCVRDYLMEYLAPGSLMIAGGVMVTMRMRQLQIG